MNYAGFILSKYNKLYSSLSKFTINARSVTNCRLTRVKLPIQIINSACLQANFSKFNGSFQLDAPLTCVLALNVLAWLGFEKDDEEKESELIMTLKRAILATKREQYEKAEQLLHVALRLAQQQQNEQGVTYCYDLMANLAFDRRELEKAEKLFISVLKRLLTAGTSQDDLKVIHISLKLARICHLKAEDEKAQIGYDWCLAQIKNSKNSDDSRMLQGVIQDWYAQFWLDLGNVEESLKHLKEAYAICCFMNGSECEQSMLLLNDLAITNWRAGDIEKAETCLKEAISIGNKLEDAAHVGVLYANLGLIYIERGILNEAKKSCQEAIYLGRKYDNKESIEQANYCFDQIKLNLSN